MTITMRSVAGIAADADTMTEAVIYFETPEWVALLKWLEFHGIDPKRVLAGTRISRDECNRCIRFVGLLLDKDGRRVPVDLDADGVPTRLASAPMIEQGEAPPLPYPDVIQALLAPRPIGGNQS